MKKILKKIIPEFIFSYYFAIKAILAALINQNPSRDMIIIGITGTKGKTSTANFIWAVLQKSGIKTGLIGTANIRIGNTEEMNPYHMTMPSPFIIQNLLKKMKQAGCKVCVMEVTSEGIKQNRHLGISFDIGVFTNLTPEHLPAHNNSFETYKETKGRFFKLFSRFSTPKKINNIEIPLTTILNSDSPHFGFFKKINSQQQISYSIDSPSEYKADEIVETTSGVKFKLNNHSYTLNILGKFNVYNALPAIIIGKMLNLSPTQINASLTDLTLIPGRMEVIKGNQKFKVVVDYAHEKVSMGALMETAKKMLPTDKSKIIVLLGAEGGGRDKNKRPEMGKIVGELADYVVVSNVDPYEDDPIEIIEDIMRATIEAGKVREINVFAIADRRTGIAKALSLAKADDIVLLTGKGAEQSMIIDGKSIPWDDRLVVAEELRNLNY